MARRGPLGPPAGACRMGGSLLSWAGGGDGAHRRDGPHMSCIVYNGPDAPHARATARPETCPVYNTCGRSARIGGSLRGELTAENAVEAGFQGRGRTRINTEEWRRARFTEEQSGDNALWRTLRRCAISSRLRAWACCPIELRGERSYGRPF